MRLAEALENALWSFSFSVRTVSLGQPAGQQDRQSHQYWRDAVCKGDDHDLSHACLPTKVIYRLCGACYCACMRG